MIVVTRGFMCREKDIIFHIKNNENPTLKIPSCIRIKAVFYCTENYLIKAGETLATISWRQVLAFCFTLLTL